MYRLFNPGADKGGLEFSLSGFNINQPSPTCLNNADLPIRVKAYTALVHLLKAAGLSSIYTDHPLGSEMRRIASFLETKYLSFVASFLDTISDANHGYHRITNYRLEFSRLRLQFIAPPTSDGFFISLNRIFESLLSKCAGAGFACDYLELDHMQLLRNGALDFARRTALLNTNLPVPARDDRGYDKLWKQYAFLASAFGVADRATLKALRGFNSNEAYLNLIGDIEAPPVDLATLRTQAAQREWRVDLTDHCGGDLRLWLVCQQLADLLIFVWQHGKAKSDKFVLYMSSGGLRFGAYESASLLLIEAARTYINRIVPRLPNDAAEELPEIDLEKLGKMFTMNPNLKNQTGRLNFVFTPAE